MGVTIHILNQLIDLHKIWYTRCGNEDHQHFSRFNFIQL